MNSVVLVASESLRLVFDYRGDRWEHRIELYRSGAFVASLSSIEGTTTDDWPPSPPFQSLHLQTSSGDGQTALLVGKAGSSHWSAAVEADAATGVLRFDVACRLSKAPSFLGSTYSIAGEANNPAVCLPRIEMLAIADACRRMTEMTDSQLAIRVLSDPATLPRTVGWQYVVSWHPGPHS